jgi:hypothetical protein
VTWRTIADVVLVAGDAAGLGQLSEQVEVELAWHILD